MQVQSIKNGLATVHLTVEDCSLLAQACAIAEDNYAHAEHSTQVWRWTSAFFAALMHAGLFQMGCRPDSLRDLDAHLTELGQYRGDIDILPD